MNYQLHTLYISLGSNLGDRAANIDIARNYISLYIGNETAFSGCIETEPVGFNSDHTFYNAAMAVETILTPEEVLLTTQQIEHDMGRTQKSENGIFHDRIIDIDLLIYDNLLIHTDKLCLPHPQMHKRRFVLEPMQRIAPNLVHPQLECTMSELLQTLNCAQIHEIKPTDCTLELLKTINYLLPQLWDEAPALTLDRLIKLSENQDIHLYRLDNEEGNMSGMATLSIDNLPSGIKAWIEDVVVDQNCRKRGYGRQLVQHLIHEARRLGTHSVNLTSRPQRTAANQMYQSMGFAQRDTNVYKIAF